ncbi:hypothetical protein Tco_0507053 [Tanacetum coccineum]
MKTAKSKPTVHKNQAFDDPDDFRPIDYMETEDAHNEKGVSIEDEVNTNKPDELVPTRLMKALMSLKMEIQMKMLLQQLLQ